MGGLSRFTVSVPTELMEAVDKELIKGKRNRSALVRRLLEEALREAEEQEDVKRYIQGYRQQPQTEDEFGWSDYVTAQALAELPWEDNETR
ncbi:MAG TPA: ribbon-helix-helix protein, CopG family [Dehalococcoidia bacterium]|nr:ribbon-helix-helix protein, CopG family [Dehalococcoidia bacterium]HLC30620.1 ribbon-helix-helix protein, CopG family [Dehalococcoidia bacterium]